MMDKKLTASLDILNAAMLLNLERESADIAEVLRAFADDYQRRHDRTGQ